MTEAEIRALFESLMADKLTEAVEAALTPAISGVLTTLQGHVDGSLQELETKLAPKAPEAPASNGGKQSPLEQRLAQLEAQLTEEKTKREQAEQAKFETERLGKLERTLNDAIGTAGPDSKYRDFVAKVLMSEVNGAKEIGGKFIVNGKEVSQVVTEFFNSPVGQHLLPAPGANVGTGSSANNIKVDDGNLDSQVAAAFLM